MIATHGNVDINNTNAESKARLTAMETDFGRVARINSAYRSPTYNADIGGAKNSQHVEGRAWDIRRDFFGDMTDQQILETSVSYGWTGIGFYNDFIHIDDRVKVTSPRGYHIWGGSGYSISHLNPINSKDITKVDLNKNVLELDIVNMDAVPTDYVEVFKAINDTVKKTDPKTVGAVAFGIAVILSVTKVISEK